MQWQSAYVCLMYCRCNGNYGRCCYCYLLLFFSISFLCFANVDFRMLMMEKRQSERRKKLERHRDNTRSQKEVDGRTHALK